MRKVISIVTPCYNEEKGIQECYETVKRIMDTELPDYDREHIFCDNSSVDRTVEILKDIAAQDPGVKIIINTRNFGILRNTYNGVLNASGDAIILFLPADLQDPPELIPQFVRLWEQEYEIVYGIRAKRQEPLLSRTMRHMYYRMISRLSYVNYPPDVGDFQLVDKKVLNAMKLFEDSHPFMRMMPFECGFRSVGVPYASRPRKYGFSRNRLSQLIDQGLVGVIAFSNAPVRLAFFIGIAISILSFAFALTLVILKLSGFEVGPWGIPTVVISIFFFGGVQLVFLGMLGEYVVAIFNQARRRPLVIERERVNFNAAEEPARSPTANSSSRGAFRSARMQPDQPPSRTDKR
jgi:glycosyltransferase involved in cell wall biosynthesis